MATRKPDNVIGWHAPNSEVVSPSVDKKAVGWKAEKPSFQHFNWFWNTISDWVDYVDDVVITENVAFDITTEYEFLEALACLENHVVSAGVTVTLNINSAAVNSNYKILHNIVNMGTINIKVASVASEYLLFIKNISGTGQINVLSVVDAATQYTLSGMYLINIQNTVDVNNVKLEAGSTYHERCYNTLYINNVNLVVADEIEVNVTSRMVDASDSLSEYPVYAKNAKVTVDNKFKMYFTASVACDNYTFLPQYFMYVDAGVCIDMGPTYLNYDVTGSYIQDYITAGAWIYKSDSSFLKVGLGLVTGDLGYLYTILVEATDYTNIPFNAAEINGTLVTTTKFEAMVNYLSSVVAKMRRLDVLLTIGLSNITAGSTSYTLPELVFSGVHGSGGLVVETPVGFRLNATYDGTVSGLAGVRLENVTVPVALAHASAAANNGINAAIKIENCSNVSVEMVTCDVGSVATLDIINSKVVVDELFPKEGVVTISAQSDVTIVTYYGNILGRPSAVVNVDKSRLFIKKGLDNDFTTIPTVVISDYADVLHKDSGGTYVKTFEGTFLVY